MKLRKSESEPARDHNGQPVKHVDHPFKFVDGILNHLLDDDSEPEGVELRHVIAEGVHQAHRLAELRGEGPGLEGCPHRCSRDLEERLREIMDEKRLENCAQHIY